jgi:hypothetical protein
MRFEKNSIMNFRAISKYSTNVNNFNSEASLIANDEISKIKTPAS